MARNVVATCCTVAAAGLRGLGLNSSLAQSIAELTCPTWVNCGIEGVAWKYSRIIRHLRKPSISKVLMWFEMEKMTKRLSKQFKHYIMESAYFESRLFPEKDKQNDT